MGQDPKAIREALTARQTNKESQSTESSPGVESALCCVWGSQIFGAVLDFVIIEISRTLPRTLGLHDLCPTALWPESKGGEI